MKKRYSSASCAPTSSTPSALARGAPSSRSRAVSAPLAHLGDTDVDQSRGLVAATASAPGHGRTGHPPPQQPATGRPARTPGRAPSTRRSGAAPLRGPLQHRCVGPDPGEQRQVVGPLQDVDRVDLEHAGPVDHPRAGAHRRAGGARVGEPLGGERDPPGLGAAQGQSWRHAAGLAPCRRSRSAGPARARGCESGGQGRRGASRGRRT